MRNFYFCVQLQHSSTSQCSMGGEELPFGKCSTRSRRPLRERERRQSRRYSPPKVGWDTRLRRRRDRRRPPIHPTRVLSQRYTPNPTSSTLVRTCTGGPHHVPNVPENVVYVYLCQVGVWVEIKYREGGMIETAPRLINKRLGV